MGDRGRTSINEDREVFNLPPIEDGDRHFIRGEYKPVDSYEGTELTSEVAEGDPLPPIGGNASVDKGSQGGIIEEREAVFGEGHKIVDNTPEGGDESGSGGSKSDKEKEQLISEIKNIGIIGDSYNIPAKSCNVDKLTVDVEHIKARKHNVTESEAKLFVSKAEISITRWNGKFENYYSSKGASYVNTEDKTIRTAFKSSEYDDKTQKMMGEIKKWKKRE